MVPEADGPAITASVVRSGGFAGLTRTWQATVDDETEAVRWRELVHSLPWPNAASTAAPAPRGPVQPDRFVYRITIWLRSGAGTEPSENEAVLPESEVTGAWRTLVEAVRDASTGQTRA